MVDRKRRQRVREGKQITEGLQKGLGWAAIVGSKSPGKDEKVAAERAGRRECGGGREAHQGGTSGRTGREYDETTAVLTPAAAGGPRAIG